MPMAYNAQEEFHLLIRPGEVGAYVILTGDPGRCEVIAQNLEQAHLVASNREFTIYTGLLDGEPVSVCSTGIGGPSAAIALEELIHCGAHTFIRVGSSGGMDIDVLGGDLVVASGAIRAEGTTREYAPIEFPAVADVTVTNALASAARALGFRYHVGVVQSKDSFYGQHDPASMPVAPLLQANWDAWLRCGALASEMECAALFIVGSVRRVRVGAVLTVLGNQTRREQGLEDIQYHQTDRVIATAVEAFRRIIAEDKKQS
ncbi:MAG: uridine phosphorylase [Eubacteriales bacterium]|nr:uridine phosphorylase [Eubacteriales bacterium]